MNDKLKTIDQSLACYLTNSALTFNFKVGFWFENQRLITQH
jgi:hypothetical protein